MGGNAYTEAVQKELSLPFDSAERAEEGRAGRRRRVRRTSRPILRAVTENLLLEIQKTFDFFKATAASDRIDRILVSGGTSRVDGFGELLAERFGAPVELFDPFRKVQFDAKKFGIERLADVAPTVGGRRGAGAQTGGRPMIRINLLAVERERAKRRRGCSGRRRPRSRRSRSRAA